MKIYGVFLLITTLILPTFHRALVLPPTQAMQAPSHVEMLSIAYTPPPVGTPVRREGAGTR